MSLGDHLSFDVSAYVGLHPDIFELPGRGAFINNNPGASILGAVPYALARPLIDRVVARVQRARASMPDDERQYNTIYPLTQEFFRQARARGLDVKLGLAAGVMQAFLMAPLSALSAVVMFYLLLSLTQSVRTATFLALLYAFATPVFYRTAQLNHNLLVSHCALFAFALLWRPWATTAPPRPSWSLWAGLLAGWAVVLDYSGLVVVGALGCYVVARSLWQPREQRRPGDVVRFAAGVSLSLVVLLAYQWLAFGHPLYPAQSYMPAVAFTDQGYRGMTWPQADLLWLTAFDIRYGLFTSAPLLLLALWVPLWLRRPTRWLGRRELLLVALMTAGFFLFTAANQYSRLQFNSGVRHVVPVSPFVFLLAANVLVYLPRPWAVIFSLGGAYWSWCLAMYRDVEQGWGVFESLIHVSLEGPRLPWLTTLERMGYLSGSWSLFLLLAAAFVIAALWGWGAPSQAQRSPVSSSR